ncbi:hypothetical protein LCGC14_3005780, partial [marine sediment metagenome]
ILIGTHALIEDVVQFRKLGLVVIDEQHSFGVAQRARLWKKADVLPHVLVMTARPIPRTRYRPAGNLDVRRELSRRRVTNSTIVPLPEMALRGRCNSAGGTSSEPARTQTTTTVFGFTPRPVTTTKRATRSSIRNPQSICSSDRARSVTSPLTPLTAGGSKAQSKLWAARAPATETQTSLSARWLKRNRQ